MQTTPPRCKEAPVAAGMQGVAACSWLHVCQSTVQLGAARLGHGTPLPPCLSNLTLTLTLTLTLILTLTCTPPLTPRVQMMLSGAYDQMAVTQTMGEFAMDRPTTRERARGQVALTVLEPSAEVGAPPFTLPPSFFLSFFFLFFFLVGAATAVGKAAGV